MQAENKIQAECFKWYNNNYCLKHHIKRGIMFSVANELAGANKIAMMQAKATGLVAGVSDTIIIHTNKQVLFCEFKNEKGKQSDKQKDFQSRVELLGFEYKIIRSLKEFQSWIKSK